MWKLDCTPLEAGSTFMTCISRVDNVALKNRLISVKDDIVSAEKEYKNLANDSKLHLISPNDSIRGIVTNEEMKSVYTGRMVPKISPGRHIYDQLLLIPPNGRCPYCGHRIVATLDHLLSKASYSSLTVMPINLVACCADCNKLKKDSNPPNAQEIYMHPYFEDIENERWLFAEVVENKQGTLRFYVESPLTWNTTLTARVEHQFSTLKLESLYRSNAAEEISNIKYMLTDLLSSGGAGDVKKHLAEIYKSRKKARINSWQTATYEAISSNDWFCNGGFL